MAVELFLRKKIELLKGGFDYTASSTEYTATALNLSSLTEYKNTDFLTNRTEHSLTYTGTGLEKEITLLNGQLKTISELGLKAVGSTVFDFNAGTASNTGSAVADLFRVKITLRDDLQVATDMVIKLDSIEPNRALRYGVGYIDAGVKVEKGKLVFEPTSLVNEKGAVYNVQITMFTNFYWSPTPAGVLDMSLYNSISGNEIIFYKGDGADNRALTHHIGDVPTLVKLNEAGSTVGSYKYFQGATELFVKDSLGSASTHTQDGVAVVLASQVTLGQAIEGTNDVGTDYEMELWTTGVTNSAGLVVPSASGDFSFSFAGGFGSMLIVDFSNGAMFYADRRTKDNSGVIRFYDYTQGRGIISSSSITEAGGTISVQIDALAGASNVLYFCAPNSAVNNYTNQIPAIDNSFIFVDDYSEFIVSQRAILGVTQDSSGDLLANGVLFNDISEDVDAVVVSVGDVAVDVGSHELLTFYSGSNGLPFSVTTSGNKLALGFTNGKLIKIGI